MPSDSSYGHVHMTGPWVFVGLTSQAGYVVLTKTCLCYAMESHCCDTVIIVNGCDVYSHNQLLLNKDQKIAAAPFCPASISTVNVTIAIPIHLPFCHCVFVFHLGDGKGLLCFI